MASSDVSDVVNDPGFSIFLYVGVNNNRFPLSVTQQMFQDIYVNRVSAAEPEILRDLCDYYTSLNENERPDATRNPDLYRTCTSNASNG